MFKDHTRTAADSMLHGMWLLSSPSLVCIGVDRHTLTYPAQNHGEWRRSIGLCCGKRNNQHCQNTMYVCNM